MKDCPHPLNYRRSKANKNKFWKCVEDGTNFEEVMIKPHERLGARPPPLHVSSDDEEYAHAILCTGPRWDEPVAQEILALVAGSPDMEITDKGLVLTFPSEGMAAEAMENLDGIITSDGDGITAVRYTEEDVESGDHKQPHDDTPEKPAAKSQKISGPGDKGKNHTASACAKNLFAKPAPRNNASSKSAAPPMPSSLTEHPEFMALTGRVTTLEKTSDRIEKKVHTIQGDLGGMSGLLQMMAASTLNLTPEEVRRRQSQFQHEAMQNPLPDTATSSADKKPSTQDAPVGDNDTHMAGASGKRRRDEENPEKWGLVKITPLKYAVKKVEVLRAHPGPDNDEGFRVRDAASGFEQWLPMADLFDSEDEAKKSLATRSRHSTPQESTQPGAGEA